jgi:hypothetical protein
MTPTLKHTLNLLDLPLWVERTTLTLPVQNLIFLAETKAEFTEAHQAQLSKILDYLNLKNYQLIYQDSALTTEAAAIILSFGVETLPSLSSPNAPYITLSIDAMLKDPSCKRQVMYDIKALKDQNS